jgi:hypothetical protein
MDQNLDFDWEHRLRGAWSEELARNPVPSRDSLTSVEEWQCRIQGGEFLEFFADGAEGVARTRAFVSEFSNMSPDPVPLFLSDRPGLVAAKEILGGGSESGILPLLEPWYRTWEQRFPDSEYMWHVSFMSYFEPWSRYVGGEDSYLGFAAEADHYRELVGDEDPATLWVHHSGAYVGPLAGQMTAHLWKWDGEEMNLLQEGFDFIVS